MLKYAVSIGWRKNTIKTAITSDTLYLGSKVRDLLQEKKKKEALRKNSKKNEPTVLPVLSEDIWTLKRWRPAAQPTNVRSRARRDSQT